MIDDVNPLNDPRPSNDPRDLRVRAYVDMGGLLWLAYATIRRRESDGKAVMRALLVEPFGPAEAEQDADLTVRTLQRFPAELLTRRALEQADEAAELDAWAAAYGLPAALPAEQVARIQNAAKELGVAWAPPRGNRGTPRVFYDALALDVVEIARQGRAVVPELVARRGRNVSTIKRWVRDARDVGALARRGWKLGPDHPASSKKEERQ